MIQNLILDAEVFNIDIIDAEDVVELMLRFLLNLGVITVIIRYLYYSITKRKDYLFTYFLVSTIVFLLCFLLENVKLQVGFALGLFAIFGILRYRTSTIPIKEMTYLFIVIGVSVINALANKKVSYAELLFSNFMVIFITYALEKVWLIKHESRKTILYEKIDLIKPEKRAELMEDLKQRTGIDINRIEIGRIDFLRDTVRIRIYYYDPDNDINYADEEDINSNNNV